jgi:hypothetical protein
MGKKIEDYREDFYAFTGKASEVNRQLALAGIAVIWIFKNPENSLKLLPQELYKPLLFLIISLTIDLLQYVLGAIIWGIFFEIKEHQVNKNIINNDNINAPNLLSWIITLLFFLKIIAMIIAYIGLLSFFESKL